MAEIFSWRNRPLTLAIAFDTALAAGFIAGAIVVWKDFTWGATNDVGNLAIGLLSVGLAAVAIGLVSVGIYLSVATKRAELTARSGTEDAAIETAPAVAAVSSEDDFTKYQVVEEAVEKWAEEHLTRGFANYSVETNKMNRHHYVMNLFNADKLRIAQWSLVPDAAKRVFNAKPTFVREGYEEKTNAAVDVGMLTYQINNAPNIDLAF